MAASELTDDSCEAIKAIGGECASGAGSENDHPLALHIDPFVVVFVCTLKCTDFSGWFTTVFRPEWDGLVAREALVSEGC